MYFLCWSEYFWKITFSFKIQNIHLQSCFWPQLHNIIFVLQKRSTKPSYKAEIQQGTIWTQGVTTSSSVKVHGNHNASPWQLKTWLLISNVFKHSARSIWKMLGNLNRLSCTPVLRQYEFEHCNPQRWEFIDTYQSSYLNNHQMNFDELMIIDSYTYLAMSFGVK